MERIAKFHKVSYEQFEGDWKDTFGPIETEEIKRIYEGIRLPARATAGSAGYDFYTPVAVTIRPGEIVKIPTGIRAEMNEGWVLAVFPRSSLGFKYRLQLNNTVGIIDSDYFFSDNEGLSFYFIYEILSFYFDFIFIWLSRHLCTWMCFLIFFLQLALSAAQINLRGRNIRMSKHLLYRLQIGTI